MIAYTYDPLNRLTAIDYPGSSLDVSLTYDQGTGQYGRLTSMIDGAGTTTFEYDAFGNLVEESKTIGGNTYVTAYAYDEADLVTSMTYPSGRTVTYARNVLGQITAVESAYGGSSAMLASGAAYEPFGPLKELSFGNGHTLVRTFDQQYRTTAQTTGTVQDLAFALDPAGNIDTISDAVDVSLSQGFGQDALHRVTTDAGSYGTKGYSYDSVGNRLTRTHGATTQTLTYNVSSNRLTTHNGQTVSLDAAGNTLSDPAENLSFSYGADNRVVESYVGGGLRATYAYDGRGRRVAKSETTGAQRTTVYHYGSRGELIGETVYSSAGGKVAEREFLWLDSLPLAQSDRTFSGGTVTSNSLVYLHADQLSTPRLATNGSGAVVWRWDSDAFGVGAAHEDPDGDTNLVNVPLRFPGQYFDEETGLHYNYFRDYNPKKGRYTQYDPIGLRGGLNTYSYVVNNPLVHVDPFGLEINIPAATENCWPNIISDYSRPTGKFVEVPGPEYWRTPLAIPIPLPAISVEPDPRRGGIEPAAVGVLVMYTLNQDVWLHEVFERSVNYEYICKDPCTGLLDKPQFGQGSDTFNGPPAEFVRREWLDTDWVFFPSSLPISPPDPTRRR
jgi:RHS repeat-associated protein